MKDRGPSGHDDHQSRSVPLLPNEDGVSPIFVAADTIKEFSQQAVAQLNAFGVIPIMLIALFGTETVSMAVSADMGASLLLFANGLRLTKPPFDVVASSERQDPATAPV